MDFILLQNNKKMFITKLKGKFNLFLASRCNTDQQGASGVIESQGFSPSYQANTSCLWLMEGPVGTTIKITVGTILL